MDCRHIRFSLNSQDLDLQELQALFNLTAFWAQNRSCEDLQKAIAHSCPVVSAWDGERLIGFGRATSDGVYRAMVWDVVIHPHYQGTGLGRKLMQTLLAHPHLSQVERVYLMTTQGQKFYERIGFQENKSTTLVFMNSSETENLGCWQWSLPRSHPGFP